MFPGRTRSGKRRGRTVASGVRPPVAGCVLTDAHGEDGNARGGAYNLGQADERSRSRRGESWVDPARAVLRSLLRRGRRPSVGQSRAHVGTRRDRHITGRIYDRLLRDLVGLDELHLVRVGLRQRRRAVSLGGAGTDRRRLDPGGRGASRIREARLECHRRGLRGHAGVSRGPLAAGGQRGPRPASN